MPQGTGFKLCSLSLFLSQDMNSQLPVAMPAHCDGLSPLELEAKLYLFLHKLLLVMMFYYNNRKLMKSVCMCICGGLNMLGPGSGTNCGCGLLEEMWPC